jgi:hypothetical protein
MGIRTAFHPMGALSRIIRHSMFANSANQISATITPISYSGKSFSTWAKGVAGMYLYVTDFHANPLSYSAQGASLIINSGSANNKMTPVYQWIAAQEWEQSFDATKWHHYFGNLTETGLEIYVDGIYYNKLQTNKTGNYNSICINGTGWIARQVLRKVTFTPTKIANEYAMGANAPTDVESIINYYSCENVDGTNIYDDGINSQNIPMGSTITITNEVPEVW